MTGNQREHTDKHRKAKVDTGHWACSCCQQTQGQAVHIGMQYGCLQDRMISTNRKKYKDQGNREKVLNL